jgi:hypothetical protein
MCVTAIDFVASIFAATSLNSIFYQVGKRIIKRRTIFSETYVALVTFRRKSTNVAKALNL